MQSLPHVLCGKMSLFSARLWNQLNLRLDRGNILLLPVHEGKNYLGPSPVGIKPYSAGVDLLE